MPMIQYQIDMKIFKLFQMSLTSVNGQKMGTEWSNTVRLSWHDFIRDPNRVGLPVVRQNNLPAVRSSRIPALPGGSRHNIPALPADPKRALPALYKAAGLPVPRESKSSNLPTFYNATSPWRPSKSSWKKLGAAAAIGLAGALAYKLLRRKKNKRNVRTVRIIRRR